MARGLGQEKPDAEQKTLSLIKSRFSKKCVFSSSLILHHCYVFTNPLLLCEEAIFLLRGPTKLMLLVHACVQTRMCAGTHQARICAGHACVQATHVCKNARIHAFGHKSAGMAIGYGAIIDGRQVPEARVDAGSF